MIVESPVNYEDITRNSDQQAAFIVLNDAIAPLVWSEVVIPVCEQSSACWHSAASFASSDRDLVGWLQVHSTAQHI